MVGLGGGFVLVPMLRLVFGLGPAEAAGTSLALVVANSGAGTIAYFLQKRVAVRTALLLAAGGIPGSLLGAFFVQRMSAATFDWLFALLLIGVAVDLIASRNKKRADVRAAASLDRTAGLSWASGLSAGLAVGVISSLFGVGGGIIAVPTLLYFTELPVHAMMGTSHLAIFLTSPVGLIAHAYERDIRSSYVVPLVIGGLVGGPIGARLSARLSPSWILILVSAAVTIAAASLVLRHLM